MVKSRRPEKRRLGTVTLVVAASFVGCEETTGPSPTALPGATPMQVDLVRPPVFYTTQDQLGNPLAVVEVTAGDSTLHTLWRPTRIRVEVIGKGASEQLLVPFACLEEADHPAEFPQEFPLNFEWWECDLVFAHTDHLFSDEELEEVEDQLGGAETTFAEPLQMLPGAFYRFVVPTGRASLAEAIRRLNRHPAVIAAGRSNGDPRCVRSDIIPPPPCPPWTASNAYRPEDFAGVSIQTGDSIRLTYTTPDGDSITSAHRVHLP